MKKIFLMVAILLCLVANCFTDESYEIDVPDEYMGTYISVQYENILHITHNHYLALNYNYKNGIHDLIILEKDFCRCVYGFYDGYGVSAADFSQYNFCKTDKDLFLIDKNGNSYKRISESIKTYDTDFKKFMLSIMFEDMLAFKDVEVLDNGCIKIFNNVFNPYISTVGYQTEGINLWLGGCALVVDGISAKLYEIGSTRFKHYTERSDEVYKEYPMFFWNEKKYPDIYNLNGIPLDQLRYLRNYIYAKHGYIFNSKDLNELYTKFEWYKPNPFFTEDSFSYSEKQFLKLIKEKEEELKAAENK